MLSNDFTLDHKSISKLSSKGLCLQSLKTQIDEDIDLSLEIWRAQGLNIVKDRGYLYFSDKFTPINEAIFCIVDIEANGSNLEKHQIIELSAVKIKNNEIIDKFDTLVGCSEINEHISEITGITVEDTKDAPKLKDVLTRFKLFLADSIFIAHDVKFDYKYISQSMQNIGLPPLLNRSICSLGLAERTIVSYRYALSYLNDNLNLNPHATHHRAMSDVITTFGLFKESLKHIDTSKIKTAEDLIRFSKEAKRLKRPKFDPLLEVETIEDEIEEIKS